MDEGRVEARVRLQLLDLVVVRSVRVSKDTEKPSENVLDVDEEIFGVFSVWVRGRVGAWKFCLVDYLLLDPCGQTGDVFRSRKTDRALASVAPQILERASAIHTSAGLWGADRSDGAVQDVCELEEVDGVRAKPVVDVDAGGFLDAR